VNKQTVDVVVRLLQQFEAEDEMAAEVRRVRGATEALFENLRDLLMDERDAAMNEAKEGT